MVRTLVDMKRDRGGHCYKCGTNIMDPSQKDHTFCNTCWDDMMRHPYEHWIDMEGVASCAFCDDPKDAAIHKVSDASD